MVFIIVMPFNYMHILRIQNMVDRMLILRQLHSLQGITQNVKLYIPISIYSSCSIFPVECVSPPSSQSIKVYTNSRYPPLGFILKNSLHINCPCGCSCLRPCTNIIGELDLSNRILYGFNKPWLCNKFLLVLLGLVHLFPF